MVINARIFFNNSWKDALVNVTSWEVRFSEIGMFIGIVKFEFQRFSNLVV